MSSPRALTIGPFVAVQRTSDFRAVPHLVGWDDAPAVRTLMEDRTLGDGSWGDDLSTIDKRVVSIPDGRIAASSHANAVAIREQLAALSPRALYDLTVDDGVYQRVAKVRVTQSAVFDWVSDVEFNYSIQLTAADPFRKATTSTTVTIAASATASFTHVGTFPAEMEVRTTGSGTVTLKAYGAIQGTGSTSVPSGTIFTSGRGFTNLPRTVVGPSGENLYNSLIPTNHWLAVVPGANSIQNTGTAPVQVTYYPTWL